MIELLKLAMGCVRESWNADGPLALSENYELVLCLDLSATAPLTTSKPCASWPGRCLDIVGRCRSFTAEAALDYAALKLGAPPAEAFEAGEFLTSMLPPIHVYPDGAVFPNDYFLWEKEPGRTQADVVRLFERAVLRAQVLGAKR